ncbi:MAG: IclR family transcriptional regulator [Herbinix sp.]|nr:IclR family transcriptional regulator [Herbinix sp.]
MKALLILNYLTESEDSVSITDISEMTGLSASTVHRVLQEMIACGLASKCEESKQYKLGYEALAMGMRIKASNYLLDISMGEMMRLNEISRETIHLIAMDEHMGIYIGKLDTKNPIGMKSRIGRRLPLYCTGGGKALMAYQSEEWIEEYLNSAELKKFTQNTKVDKQELLQELKLIREKGYAIDNKEHNPDIICISAPILDHTGKAVSAMSISAPEYRFPLEQALMFSKDIIDSTALVTKKISDRK